MLEFNLPDMSCGHCKATVEKTIAAVDQAARVSVDLDKRTVEVSGTADSAALLKALADEGYPATVAA